MMRTTQSNLVFCTQIGPARFTGWKPTNQNINKIIMWHREKRKMRRHFGSTYFGNPDRENYMGNGEKQGPNKTVTYVRQSKAGKQFEHYNTRDGEVGIFEHTKFGQPFAAPTGWFPDCYGQLQNQKFQLSHFDQCMRGNRGATNQLLDAFGAKSVNITDKNAPRVGDLFAHRHKLYVTNFPWVKDPITNHVYGDADWQWKNADEFDYDKTRAKDHASFDSSILCETEDAVRARQKVGSQAVKKSAKA